MASDALTAPAPPPGDGRLEWGIAAVLAAATGAVYLLVLLSMAHHGKEVDDDSHGFLIVPLALYFVYERLRDLRRLRGEPSWPGHLPLALGTLSLGVGQEGDTRWQSSGTSWQMHRPSRSPE